MITWTQSQGNIIQTYILQNNLKNNLQRPQGSKSQNQTNKTQQKQTNKQTKKPYRTLPDWSRLTRYENLVHDTEWVLSPGRIWDNWQNLNESEE